MRTGWLVLGLLLGAAGYFVWTSKSERQSRPLAFADGAGETTAHPKHHVQNDQDRMAVGAMIEEIVHHPDIPETPVKQAFEHAIER